MKARFALVAALTVTALLVGVLAGCAAPPPQVVEKIVTQVVEKKVIETQVVEKTVVETQVVEKEVEKEVVVTATPAPAVKNPLTPEDDTLVIAHNQDGFHTLDMRQGYPDASAQFVNMQILEGLVMNDDKLQIRDQLAEKWEANADNSEFTFYLKKGVKFHDGEPFNAQAVKKHFDFFLSDPPSPVAATLRPDIKSIDVVDDHTIKITLNGSRPFFLGNLAESPAQLIYSPKTIDLPDEERARNIAGTGPYKIKEWLGQRDLMLEANMDYQWGSSYFKDPGPPKMKTIRVLNAADTESRLASLMTGETQFITLVPDAYISRLQQDPNFSIVSKLVPGMPQMNYINVTIPPTNDVRVRKAILHATNKDEIDKLVYFDTVEPAFGPLSKANVEYNPEVEKLYPFDLEKAKALLKEAGWWDEDGDGVCEAHGVKDVKDGTPLEARIVRGRSWQQYSDVWQRQLNAACFRASIIMVASSSGDDWGGCINQVPANGDVFLDSVVGMSRDWNKDQCTGGAMNFGCTCETELQPPIDQYLEEAQKAQTMDERKTALGKLQMYIMENALEAPIYELYWHAGALSSLKDIKTDATGFYYYFKDANWER
jgi:peptide/nickel transport system substrate-binding protein